MFLLYYTIIALALMVLDLLTISLVSLQLVSFLSTDIPTSSTNPFFNKFISYFSASDILIVIILRFIVQIYQTYLINSYAYTKMRNMTISSLQSCLTSSYSNFSSKSVGSWVHLIATESENYAYHYLKPRFSLLADFITLIGIFTLLLISNYIVTLFLILILISYGGLTGIIFVPLLRKLGRSRLKQMTLRNSIMSYLLNNWLINKLRQEDTIIKGIQSITHKIKNIGILQETIKLGPRSLLELLIFSSIPLILLSKNPNLIDLNTLSIFGLSAIRILPLFNNFMQSLNSMAYGKAAFDELSSILNLPKESISMKTNTSFTDKLAIFTNVTKNYSGIRIKKLSKSIKVGHTLIVGPSGSGKSTFIRLLLGIDRPEEGEIEISERMKPNEIEYIPQKAFIAPGSLKTNYEILNISRFLDILKKLSLSNISSELLDTEIPDFEKIFSGGELQRLKLALCIYKKPKILILDEALNAVDDKNRSTILIYLLQVIENVIMISHDSLDAKYFKKRLIL